MPATATGAHRTGSRPWLFWFGVLLVLVVYLAPRLISLDHFVNSDERKWMARSGNFYHALYTRDWPATFQKEHPGVTVTWAGTASLFLQFPEYARLAPGDFTGERLEMETFLRDHGFHEVDILVGGRIIMILAGALAVLVAFTLVFRLLGAATAMLSFLLLALDPFLIALARMLHVDGLETHFMFLVFVAWMAYVLDGHKRRYLVIGGLAAGLAWLTKVPSLFMGPFVGLILLIEIGLDTWGQRRLDWRLVGRLVGDGLIWGFTGIALFVIAWPAMWVNPIGVLVEMVSHAFLQAGGHGNVTYFNGELIGRFEGPGMLFYPITWLWRTTPSTLVGASLALVAFLVGRRLGMTAAERRVVGYVTLLVVCFALFMDLGEKRFDRYLLPAYPPIALAAGIGWVVVLRRVRQWLPQPWGRAAAVFGAVLVVAAQAWAALPLTPHFMAYYNPWMGGGRRAPEVMMVGWGEGLDEAARYLNAKGDPEDLEVASWYSAGSFSYFFDGRKVDGLEFDRMPAIDRWLDTDYFVLYIHQWQRQLPELRFLDYMRRFTPEHEIVINDIPYAQIYAGRAVPPPPYLSSGRAPRYVDWDGSIRLLGYVLPETPLAPGDELQADFFLENIAPIDRNLNVLVRVTDAAGNELLRDEGWPWGSATSGWPLHAIWRDGHTFTVPEHAQPGIYRVELSFYDPSSLEPLAAIDAQTDDLLPPTHIVDWIVIQGDGNLDLPTGPPLATFGDRYQLDDAQVQTGAAVNGGDAIAVTLSWSALQAPQTLTTDDFSSFVHLVGPDGELVAQHDVAPANAFIPPRLWQPRPSVPQNYTVNVPDGVEAGRYQLWAGLYNDDGRLSATMGGVEAGDAVLIGEVEVR